MKAVGRIQRVKNAWDFVVVSLEVVDFATRGEIRRAIVSTVTHLGDPTRNSPKKPATIKVKSARGPVR